MTVLTEARGCALTCLELTHCTEITLKHVFYMELLLFGILTEFHSGRNPVFHNIILLLRTERRLRLLWNLWQTN